MLVINDEASSESLRSPPLLHLVGVSLPEIPSRTHPASAPLARIIREDFVFAQNRPACRGVSIPPLAGLKTNPGFVVTSAEGLILSEGPEPVAGPQSKFLGRLGTVSPSTSSGP